MKKVKKFIAFFLIILSAIMVWQYELMAYGLMQAQGQLKVIFGAKPTSEVLSDPNFPDSLKSKLTLVGEIREYSFNHLGINKVENYKTIYDQKGEVSLWNLTACKPFELEAKTWSFPLLGSFPYKGFFDLEKAKKERDQLDAQGFDTRIRPVSGWSTLGWFDDPVLSNMLYRPTGQLVELIIHELTHGTLYIKDSADYNENLATFIGEKGALKFLADKFGIQSKEYQDYIEREQDYDRYIRHFIAGARSLDSLYATIEQDLDRLIKLQLKEEHIRLIIDNLDTIQFHSEERYRNRFINSLPNNAYFMSFLRYHSKQNSFEEEFSEKFNNDLRAYLNYLKEKYPSL